MAKIINLRTHRKQSARAGNRREAEEHAARHGRSKAERFAQAAQAEKARAHLDGHQITEPAKPDDGQSAPPALSCPNVSNKDAVDPAP